LSRAAGGEFFVVQSIAVVVHLWLRAQMRHRARCIAPFSHRIAI
jgi:hypothetical protein